MSSNPRQTPDLGDFKAPREETATPTPSRPRDPKPAGSGPGGSGRATSAAIVIGAGGATPFQLSRIYAKGWQAGMNSPSEKADFDSIAVAETLNPCHASTERERWALGFTQAVARKLSRPGRRPMTFRLSTG